MSQRRVAVVALLALSVSVPARALRVSASVATEKPVSEVTLRVLAGAVSPDDGAPRRVLGQARGPAGPIAVEVPDGALPVRVEVAARGHLAAAVDVVTTAQAELPPLWLPAGGTVTVRVVRDGKPVAGAEVGGTVEDVARPVPGRWIAAVPTRLTDGSGAVELPVPASGRAQLWARGADRNWGELDLDLKRPGAAVLRLVSRPLRVAVRRLDGTPLAGVRLADPQAPAGVAVASGADGAATVPVAREGQFEVQALGDGCSARIVLNAIGQSPVSLVCAPSATVSVRWGREVPSAWLRPGWIAPALVEGWQKGAGGRTELPGVGGEGELAAWAPGCGPVSVSRGPTAAVVLLALRAEAVVTGAVVDRGGSAVPALPVWGFLTPRWRRMAPTVQIEMLQRPLLPFAVSDATGAFVVNALAAGPLRLQARRAGRTPGDSGMLTLAAGERRSVKLKLDSGTTLVAIVTDPDGRPIRGVRAEVGDRPGGRGRMVFRFGQQRAEDPVAAGSSDQDGRVNLAAVPPGPAIVGLTMSGYVQRSIEVDVPKEGLDMGTVTLEPGLTVQGRVIDERGAPVPDAEVSASGSSMGRGRPEARSDAQGFFAIPDRPRSGQLFVSASAEGYVNSEPVRVQLPPAGPVEVRLRKGRALEGRVVDVSSAGPVGGATISVDRTAERALSGGGFTVRMMMVDSSRQVESDTEGRFRIEGLSAGSWDLRVHASGYRDTTVAAQVPEVEPPRPVTVLLDKGLDVHGVVLGTDGAPVVGAQVDSELSGAAQASIARPATVTTGEGGRFVVEGLAPGRVTLTATGEGGGTVREIVEAGRAEDVELRLAAPGSLAGRVVAAGGETPRDVDVTGWSMAQQSQLPEVQVGPDGSFAAERVAPGQYEVSAVAPGWSRASSSVSVESGQTARVELTLKQGGTVTGHVLGLTGSEMERCLVLAGGARAKPGPDGAYRVTGVTPGTGEVTAILIPDGKRRAAPFTLADIDTPVQVDLDFGKGATLSGTLRRGGAAAAGVTVDVHSGTSGGSSVTDSAGAWEVGGLDPGQASVRVLDARGRVLLARTVSVTTDRRLDLDLPSGVLRGRVVAMPERKPLAGAGVGVRGTGDNAALDRSVLTDEAGAFRVEDLPDGTFNVRGEASGYTPAERAGTLSMSAGPDVTLELQPEQRLVLQVHLANGAAPDQVNLVAAHGGAVDASLWVQADRSGEAVVTGLPAGTFTFLVSSFGEAALFGAPVPGGPLAVQLRPTGSVHVAPARGALVRLVAADSGLVVPVGVWQNPGRSEWMAADGGIDCQVPFGPYQVQIQRNGLLVEPIGVEVQPGEVKFVSLGQ